MQETDNEQDGHPPIKDVELTSGVGKLDTETYPEKEGKDGVKLSVNQEGLQDTGHPVCHRPSRRIRKGP